MRKLSSALGVVAVLVLSVGFASLNGSQRVTLRLGVATFYGVPLTVVAFGGLVVGMVIMLAASVRSDLKVRKILRARLEEESREEQSRFVDGSQQDLFQRDAPVRDPYVGDPRVRDARVSDTYVGDSRVRTAPVDAPGKETEEA